MYQNAHNSAKTKKGS